MKAIAFYLGLGMLFAHELDAVPNREWRLLPVLSSLSDETAMAIFIFSHVPVVAILLAFVSSQNLTIRNRSRLALCIFLAAHAALHIAFSGHTEYEFSSRLSSVLIFGGAIFGAIYCGLEARDRYSRITRPDQA